MIELFGRLFSELLEDEKRHAVAPFIPSTELKETLDLSLKNDPLDEAEFEKVLKELVFATTRTATPGFFNQLFGGRNEKAVLGDLLAVVLNNSMYTYKAAGPQTGVEKTILRKVCDQIGWDEQSDGTFAPGGSLANMMSMVMARDRHDADLKFNGTGNNLRVYTSEESHYSIAKNAAFTGIGRNNVRYVPATKRGEMDASALERMIEEDIANGCVPVLVNLTAGTTVLGAFDPIPRISAICQKHKVWLHLDGAYCGAVLLSAKHEHLIEGVENVDSFSFNAHKMLGTPLSCSLIVAKDKRHLQESFSADASYLYQTNDEEYNLGKTSLQCGRRNDALKLWTLWKSIGTSGLEGIVDHQFDLADTARAHIRGDSDYTLYSFDESVSVCFNYKDISAKSLCTELYEQSELLVGYGSFQGEEFVRLVTVNAQNGEEEILQFFQTLERFVHENEHALLEEVH